MLDIFLKRDDNYIDKRPTWDDFFLGLAFIVSKRSHDGNTQCGSIIVDKSNDILATGYNGFIRNIDDSSLPNLRPNKDDLITKYNFMVHAEHNAILSCARNNKSCKDCKIYITGKPCSACLQYIWQVGITEVIHGSQFIKMKNNQHEQLVYDKIVELTKHKLIIREVDFNPMAFLTDMIERLR